MDNAQLSQRVTDLETRYNERFDTMMDLIKKQNEILQPISDAFKNVQFLGQSGKTIIVVVSLVIGIGVGIVSLIKFFWMKT